MIHNNAPLPIYLQLEGLIRDKLDNGEWPPGAMLPSERQLCEVYGVARMTVRQAISNLIAKGLLSRVQGRGTFVARPPLRQSLSKLTSFSEDMRDRGLIAREPGARGATGRCARNSYHAAAPPALRQRLPDLDRDGDVARRHRLSPAPRGSRASVAVPVARGAL